ncbi:MAG: PKD domain-containing protein [Candidatus Aminicenantes bacterium]|nr:PKD domain-containing protein [Candidatus Aminicenantes bacterium]NIQ66278.1 PKD domain-containing protein [Candidatus Aminicenantes bacterium]NIT22285.1 PKD domain-containing protein [Candidatus Aminicenantes bacterium]
MNNHTHHGKTMVLVFLFFSLLLALSSIGGSPPQPGWDRTPSLKAVLSPDDGRVELSWEPRAGAVAYRVFRAPLTAAPYDFTLLAELSAFQTSFIDESEDIGSVVYKVVAVGAGNFVYPLAARLTVDAFGGLVPISLEFHPNTVETALASLGAYDVVEDANTGETLSERSQLQAGMVLRVKGFMAKQLVMVGTQPSFGTLKLKPNKYKLFAVPLTPEKISLKHFEDLGLKDMVSHSFVFTDGNNRQLPGTAPYLPGHVYGVRSSRGTDIDFVHGIFRQDDHVIEEPQEGPEELLGGSPDDGTLVKVLYDDSYETKLYKCWDNGKSGAWDGVTDNASGADNVKNAAVVRRGRTMYVKDEAGMTSSTPVTVLAPSEPGNPRQTVSWNISWNSSLGAAAIQIPASAPVGDYQVRVGTDPENYVTVYIIFDPSYAAGYLDANQYRSWAYSDDDWQTVPDLKNYLNYVFEGPGYPLGSYPYVYGYRGDSSAESGADGGVFGQRHVEIACSIHGTGAKTTTEAALYAYQVIGQRVSWVSGNGWYGNDGGEYNTFDDNLIGYIKAPSGIETATELDVVTAEQAALGLGWTNRLPSAYVIDAGACFNYGTSLAAMIRALGIPARCHHGIGSDGWTSSFHVWAEAFLDSPEIHPLDPNWWNSYWYEFDCNNYYTGHSTSHSEGSISPIVIDGFGDYLINEYIQCEGIGYDGSFYDNSFKCVPPGSNTGTHTAVPLEIGTTNDAEDNDSYPLVITYANSNSAWVLLNTFVPWDGPARPSGDVNVYDDHHGYALNDTQTGPDGGSCYIANSTNEDDLPVLMYGIEQKGLVAGWGWMMYRVPVEGRDTITVQLVEGADKVEILATLDRSIYSTYRRWELDYDFISDAGGVLTANTSGGDQLYLWIQLKGFSHSNPGLGQETAWYTILAGDAGPYIHADFSFNKLSDYEVQFTDESIAINDTIVSWSWDFGDGNTSTQQNPTHTYASAAYYDVTLTVTGESTTTDSETQQIWIGPNQAPTADFTYTTLGGNVVSFADQSTDSDGTVVGWSWDFGDGGTSTDQNPVHTYPSPGTYSVTLTVTDDDGATDSITQDVTLTLQYCASSSSSDSFHITRFDLGSFSNSSGGSTYTDFSDLIIYVDPGGSYSTTIIVNDSFWTGYTRIWIDYNRDGDFTDANELVFQKAQSGGTISDTIDIPSSGVVTGLKLGLRVHTDTMNYKEPCDQNSGWGEVEDYSIIVTGGGGNIAPNADFTYTTDNLMVDFTDTSTDVDGTITDWSWDFGDGNTSTQQNPSHTYASDGTYTVSLTVTDNGGLSDSTSKDVTVSSGGGNIPPTADFTFTTDGLTVLFTDQSSDSDGTIDSWSWDFGDGNVSTALNVGHTYTAEGTYTVTLTVTDNDGDSDSVSKNVTVNSESTAPEADFTFTVNGLTVDFTDDSRDPDPDGSITGWSWDFGDGNTSTQQNPSHTYASADTFTVTLTVTDNNGLTDSVSKDVTTTSENTPPTADFTFTTNDLTANFTDTSTDADGTITNWSWDFGDGNTSTQQNPSHTYASAGTYTVTLTVTDNDGASDSTSQNVTVSAPQNQPPTADFTFTTNGLTANFTDTSTDSDGTIQSWSWDFGDGNTSTQQNPSHTYASAGTYTVTLTVTDDDSATNSTSKSVTVSDGGGVPDYCPSSSGSADPMYINGVIIADLTNPSGKSTYSDFTHLTINMEKGQSYSVTVRLDDDFYTAYTRIWIDFNRDGDFDDSGELVLQKAKKSKVTGTITIPSSGVVTGQKLGLRIHSDTMSYRGPCSDGWGWGEVEDYAVIIQ